MNADNWNFRIDGREQATWHGGPILIPYHDIKDAGGTFVGVRVFDVRALFADSFGDSRTEKIGYAIHHDAAVMADTDKNFNGSTIDEELDRIQIIWDTHVTQNGWGGVGYHRIIGPSGRVYITGGSATQRAHVANLNHLWIGYCFMGDWSSSRPSDKATNALRAALAWETTMRGVPMQMSPHKRLTPGTECPGGWAAVDAWEGLVLQPTAVVTPPPPPPPPTVDLVAARAALNAAQAQINRARTLLGG